MKEVCADRDAVGQAALEPVDEQDRRLAVGRREREGLPDRARPEDHHVLAARDASSDDRANGDRDGLDQGGERRVQVARRERPATDGIDEPLLERAVDVDAGQADLSRRRFRGRDCRDSSGRTS